MGQQVRGDHEEDTESKLLELHKQVEQLGLMLKKQKQSEGPGLKIQVERLSKQRDELLERLSSRDEQLANFKSSLAQLNAEYMKEMAEVKEEVVVLTEKVRAKSDQYNRMAKEQEETFAKLSALDTEHQKSLKTILGLQTYITELPPKEEVRQLKSEIEEERRKRQEIEVQAKELQRQLAQAVFLKSQAEESRAEQEKMNRDLREKGEQMAEQLREVERARIEARGGGAGRVGPETVEEGGGGAQDWQQGDWTIEDTI